jgi:glycosyltransferase involved in cell wall biosynthesis
MKKCCSVNNKKIIYIIDNLYIGGAQVHLLRLVDALVAGGYEIEIVCLGGLDESLIEAHNKIKIHKINMKSIRNICFFKGFLNLISLLKERKPSIAHTYLNTANVFGILAAKIANIPVVITSRRDMGHYRTKRIGLLEEIMDKFANAIVCVSKSSKNKLIVKQGFNPDKVKVIHNGVNISIFKRSEINKRINNFLIVGMVSAFDRVVKGDCYFIYAAEEVLKNRKDVKFVLIGNGPIRKSLEEHVIRKGIAEYFEFKGKSNNVQEELGNFDIFVIPSLSEGISNAVLEAMAMEIPVVATSVDGNLEIIEDGVSGFLVSPKDSSAIANKILEILNSPTKMKEVGCRAREIIIEQFSINKMTKNYVELYENELKKVGYEEKPLAKIGYIVSLFPCWSETFIINELVELKKRGIGLTIFSIRKDFEKFTQEKARQFIKDTRYTKKIGIVLSLFFWFIRRPLVILGLFIMVLGKRYNNFKEFTKHIWCIVVASFFARIAKKEGIEHLHAHFATYPAFTAFAINKLTGIPYTFTCHAHDIFLDKTFLKEVIAGAKTVVTISDYNKRYIVDYCGNGVADKISVIHCGLNLSDFQLARAKKDGGRKNIVSIGRFTEMKGFEYLIKACNRLKESIDFKCRIIGEGPFKNQLQNLIDTSGLNKYVALEGVQDNQKVRVVLNEADIFVLPSVWSEKDGQDGIPVVLMEAMASGVPVVASRLSGIPELVIDKSTGLLVEPRDEAGLAQKIMELTNDSILQKELVLNARRKIEQEFNAERSADSLINLFSQTKRKLKVLFVIWSLEKGGAERFLVSLIKHLDKNKIKPTVCCLNWEGAWAKELEDTGVEVIALSKKGKFDIVSFVRLFKIIKHGKFDIVNTHLWGADVLGRLAAIFAGTPAIISTVQNVDIWKKWRHRLIDKILSYKTAKIIAVSEAVKKFYVDESISADKIEVIPNAIEIDKYSHQPSGVSFLRKSFGIGEGETVFAVIGRLVEQKGHKYLFEALSALNSKYDLKLLVIGDGPLLQSLKSQVASHQLENRVIFTGRREDIPEILSIVDAVILPSLYEGLPVIVLEAMAAGRPVIATDVGGTGELVVNNETGFLVPAGDSQALVGAMEKLVNLPDKGRGMARVARERVVHNFSIQFIALKTAELFLSLARKN